METRGRPAVLYDRDKRRIGRYLASNLDARANEVIANLNLPVSKSTIVRFLSEDHEYIPMKPVPHLSGHHIQQRRDIIRGWVAAAVDWSKVIISDEKRWCLDGPDGIAYYWHKFGDERRYLSRLHFGGGSVMCWAGMSAEGLLPLVWIEGNLDSHKYIEVLEKNLVPYVDDGWLFQQDNAPAHVSRLTLDYLNDKNVDLLPWPANSPDLSPIENLWGIITRHVYHGKPRYESFAALKAAVSNAWYSLSYDEVANLMAGMGLRCLDAAEVGYKHIGS